MAKAQIVPIAVEAVAFARSLCADVEFSPEGEDVLRVHTAIHTTRLFPTSRLVSQDTGLAIPRDKAIVGENAGCSGRFPQLATHGCIESRPAQMLSETGLASERQSTFRRGRRIMRGSSSSTAPAMPPSAAATARTGESDAG
jgi:hypothetical protein